MIQGGAAGGSWVLGGWRVLLGRVESEVGQGQMHACTSLGLGGSDDLQGAVVRVGPTEAGGGMKP